MSPTFSVRLFGPARETAGDDIVEVEVDPPATAGSVLEEVARQHPALAPLLSRSRVAVDRAYVDPDTAVDPGREVAILPPVGGG